MYNYLLLSALEGGNFEPSKLLSSIVCVYRRANISVFSGAGIRPFVFSVSSFSEEQMQGNEENITKGLSNACF